MSAAVMDRLKAQGWYISEHGYNLASDSGSITDVPKIIKRCLDFDLREIGSGQGNVYQGNIVLQIQKIRNIAIAKTNEESHANPRMLKLSLTDGKNNFHAIEVEYIASLSINTPPGTKLYIRPGKLLTTHTIILLRPSNIGYVLGGRVTTLIEKWELHKKLASHTRARPAEEGGPPSWIPFGKKIVKVLESDKNFKALAEKEKPSKENSEFEAQRKDAIAEATKQGHKKVFGGGNKQLLDHSVQKIVDHGFSIEQAEYALKISRNNVDKALKSLQKTDTKHKEPRDSRETRGKRFDKKAEESKPSSGKISLFDFLEDKLPIQPESTDKSRSLQSSENNFDNFESKNTDVQSGKSGRSHRGGRGYQAQSRHVEETKNSKKQYNGNSVPSQYSQYSGGNTVQQYKPPRFQRNQDTQNYYQQDNGNRGAYQKTSQLYDYKNTSTHSRTEGGNVTDTGNYKNSSDYQSKNSGGNKNYNYVESEVKKKHPSDASDKHVQAQDATMRKPQAANATDKNYTNQANKYPHDTTGSKAAYGSNSQKSGNQNTNIQNTNISTANPWVWQIGDKCLAKYWEDNRFYNAVVTGVSERTCVVQFKGFENFEEVLQIDCLPVTQTKESSTQDYKGETRKQDQHFANRHSRYDQGQNHPAGTDFRRGTNGNGFGNKGYGKKRPQRNTQQSYQPSTQRSYNCMPTNTQNNPLF